MVIEGRTFETWVSFGGSRAPLECSQYTSTNKILRVKNYLFLDLDFRSLPAACVWACQKPYLNKFSARKFTTDKKTTTYGERENKGKNTMSLTLA